VPQLLRLRELTAAEERARIVDLAAHGWRTPDIARLPVAA
jgi:hypothetical protein